MNVLKRLEIQGFKSFTDKIKLEFNHNLTAVVGPNGSGKSNIADAVRWVLGEQSAKSLRGMKMEDVIFAGTENRRPLGFAEVSIVMDNSSHILPIDFNEVKITRRVFRSGESDYLLNGVACRLKDIHSLLMDTGIGREGYSIIGQGRIEEILSARSEDRRYLFEEAAGIVKFKNKKQEALNKLEKQRQNLSRAEDVLSVLESQLEPLKDQSDKAKAYLAYKERLKALQISMFLTESQRLEEALATINANLETVIRQHTDEERQLNALKEDGSLLRENFLQAEEAMKTLAHRLAEARSQREQKENDIVLAKEQLLHARQEMARIQEAMAGETAAQTALAETLAETQQQQDTLARQTEEARAALSAQETAFATLNATMSGSQQQIDQYNQAIMEQIRLATEAGAEADRLQNAYTQLEAEKEKLEEACEQNEAARQARSLKIDALKKLQAQLLESLAAIQDEQTTLAGEKEAAIGKLQQLEVQHRQAAKTLQEASSRFKILSDYENSYEGYYKSVKTLLQQKQKQPSAFAGVCGAVGQLVEAEPAYATAIDVALGAATQNVVTQTDKDAMAAIQFLKETQAGRVTFLPMTAMKAKGLGRDKDHLLKEKGVVGLAKDLCRYDAAYEGVFAHLLGNVLVVDKLANASAIHKKYGYAHKMVTCDGELLSAGGAMTGGSLNQKSSGIFNRSREIKALKESIAALTAENDILQAQLEKESHQLGIIKEKQRHNQSLLHEKALEQVTMKENLAQAEEALTTLVAQAEALAAQDSQLMARLQETNRAIRRHAVIQVQAEEGLRQLHAQLAEYQNSMATHRETQDSHIQQLTDLKVALSAKTQSLENLASERARIDAELSASRVRMEQLSAQCQNQETHCQGKEQEIQTFEAEKAQLAQQYAIQTEALTKLEAQKAVLSDQLNSLADLENQSQAVLLTLQGEKARLDMKKEHLTDTRRSLYDNLWEEYGLTPQTAKAYADQALALDIPFDQMKKDERKVKEAIAGLGNVNVGAIEQYKEVRTQYEELSAQRADILEAEKQLKVLIDELTAGMEKQFKQEFSRISESFAQVFKEMFSGGQAYLKLGDESNVLECGIDIIARPPGKTLQSMSLLSGGERSLTATALLFGILRLKPSPFCILDEVDAALDDANVKRYANFLQHFSEDTQFLLITHRKGTMEAADVLYGVTMQEQGISKLVSVDFAQAVKAV